MAPKTVDGLQDLVCRLIPYVEDIQKDKAYKPGAIAKLLREMRDAILVD